MSEAHEKTICCGQDCGLERLKMKLEGMKEPSCLATGKEVGA